MQTQSSPRALRLLALVGALAPIALVGGCGGGSNSGPTAMPTATPVAGTALRGAAFRLDNGQSGIVDLRRGADGRTVTGTLVVLEARDPRAAAVAATFLLPPTSYPLTGTFSEPNSFAVAASEGSSGRLSLSGTLPTNTTEGTYDLVYNGVRRTGVLSGQSLPDFDGLVPYRTIGDLQFTDFQSRGAQNSAAPFSIDFVPVTPTGANAFNGVPDNQPNTGVFGYSFENSPGSQGVFASGTRTNRSNNRQNIQVAIQINAGGPTLESRPGLLKVGQIFDLTLPRPDPGLFSGSVFVTANEYRHSSIGGTMRIRSIGPDSISVELRDVTVANDSTAPRADLFPGDGSPISTFKVNGVFTATGLSTQVNR